MLQRADVEASCPGVDRVLWLRVHVRDGRPTAGVVHGVRRHRPVEIAVPAATVQRLLARGVPAVPARTGAEA